jgi:hypothetical protein
MSVKRFLIALIASGSIVSTARAADIWCGGSVSALMADHPSCGGQLAFKTTATGGVSGVWMCARSREANVLLLAAQVAGRDVSVYIEGGDVSGCTALPSYRQISYVISYP